jgi:hypothetical protein
MWSWEETDAGKEYGGVCETEKYCKTALPA